MSSMLEKILITSLLASTLVATPLIGKEKHYRVENNSGMDKFPKYLANKYKRDINNSIDKLSKIRSSTFKEISVADTAIGHKYGILVAATDKLVERLDEDLKTLRFTETESKMPYGVEVSKYLGTQWLEDNVLAHFKGAKRKQIDQLLETGRKKFFTGKKLDFKSGTLDFSKYLDQNGKILPSGIEFTSTYDVRKDAKKLAQHGIYISSRNLTALIYTTYLESHYDSRYIENDTRLVSSSIVNRYELAGVNKLLRKKFVGNKNVSIENVVLRKGQYEPMSNWRKKTNLFNAMNYNNIFSGLSGNSLKSMKRKYDLVVDELLARKYLGRNYGGIVDFYSGSVMRARGQNIIKYAKRNHIGGNIYRYPIVGKLKNSSKTSPFPGSTHLFLFYFDEKRKVNPYVDVINPKVTSKNK